MVDPQFIEKVVEKHQQLYSDSCPASLIEMILKIEKLADDNYFEEQERDKNNPVGLSNLDGKKIHGLRFKRLLTTDEGPTLKEKIDAELGANRVVGIFVPGPNQQNAHGWVLSKDEMGYFIIAKESHDPAQGGNGKRTCEFSVDDAWINTVEANKKDVICYEREEPKPKETERENEG